MHEERDAKLLPAAGKPWAGNGASRRVGIGKLQVRKNMRSTQVYRFDRAATERWGGKLKPS